MGMSLLPKTKEGWMQFEYAIVGILISTLIGAAFLFGLKVGWGYGVEAASTLI
jgi:hypothetical protein